MTLPFDLKVNVLNINFVFQIIKIMLVIDTTTGLLVLLFITLLNYQSTLLSIMFLIILNQIESNTQVSIHILFNTSIHWLIYYTEQCILTIQLQHICQ